MANTATPGARHALYAVLEDVLGHEHADTLMSYLPEHRAEEAATKADLTRLEAATRSDLKHFESATRSDLARVETRLDQRMDGLEARFDGLEARFDRLEDRLDRWQRTMYVGQITALTALTAIFSLINAFFG